jgi:hypothetical protein
MKTNGLNVLAHSARDIVRDAEWLIRKMDRTSDLVWGHDWTIDF